jgi:hypothetical protein
VDLSQQFYPAKGSDRLPFFCAIGFRHPHVSKRSSFVSDVVPYFQLTSRRKFPCNLRVKWFHHDFA